MGFFNWHRVKPKNVETSREYSETELEGVKAGASTATEAEALANEQKEYLKQPATLAKDEYSETELEGVKAGVSTATEAEALANEQREYLNQINANKTGELTEEELSHIANDMNPEERVRTR